MAHNIKLPQFRDDMFAELEKVKDEGKIKAWGVCLGPAIGWREEGIKAMIEHDAKAVQTVYNLFEQNPGREFCEIAARHARPACWRACTTTARSSRTSSRSTRPSTKNDHRKFRDQAWKIYGLKKLELIRPLRERHGMTVHQLACKWLLQDPALTSITGTFLNEKEIKEAAEATGKPNLTQQELDQIADDYRSDWDLGAEAHPCDLKSSTDPSGTSPKQLRPAAGADRVTWTLRYVILRHEGIDDPHFDLMFEPSHDSALVSARLSEWPMTQQTAITRIADHRREYLEFEGAISGNRGSVHRVAAGNCTVHPDEDGSFLLVLEFGRLVRIPPLDGSAGA